MLKKQEKFKEAEALYERTVAIRSKALGASPDTANAMFNLALLYELSLNLAEAEVSKTLTIKSLVECCCRIPLRTFQLPSLIPGVHMAAHSIPPHMFHY